MAGSTSPSGPQGPSASWLGPPPARAAPARTGTRLHGARLRGWGQSDGRYHVMGPVSRGAINGTDRAASQGASQAMTVASGTTFTVPGGLHGHRGSVIGFLAGSDGLLALGEVSCSYEAP